MDLTQQIYHLFDGFQNKECYVWKGSDSNGKPYSEYEIENQLNQIKANSPIPLPEDYCQVFRVFGGGGFEDRWKHQVMPDMAFWTWDKIQDFHDTMCFFDDCPNGLPFADDSGDMVYFMLYENGSCRLYMTEKSTFWDEECRIKIADSFTQLFTDEEVQRLFRNYFSYGYDRGDDGRS